MNCNVRWTAHRFSWLETADNILESSGWAGELVQAGVATSGKADSFLKASHVTLTRRDHSVTACVLHLAWEKAHQEHVKSTESNTEPLSPRASQTGAQFSKKLHAIAYCPAAAAHHTRVYALYLGWQLPAAGINPVIDAACTLGFHC